MPIILPLTAVLSAVLAYKTCTKSYQNIKKRKRKS